VTTARRPPYANKIIARIRARQQTAADNAKLIDAGLTPPPAALHGHSALCRQQGVDAYGQRLEMLMRADFERQAVQLSAFIGSVIGDIDAGRLQGRMAPAPAHLQ
jgi:hypothetical protein